MRIYYTHFHQLKLFMNEILMMLNKIIECSKNFINNLKIFKVTKKKTALEINNFDLKIIKTIF